MTNKHQPERPTGPDQQRSPERARRLGKALIALARAQLEAEAQAQATGTGQHKKSKKAPPTADQEDAA
jgi:hypothetical protein